MPLSFRCETCRRSIRVPDGSEGKLTRCPDCFSIVLVPFQPSEKAKPNSATQPEDDPLGIVGKHESRWEPEYSSPSSSNDQLVKPIAPANPFADNAPKIEAPPSELSSYESAEIAEAGFMHHYHAEQRRHTLTLISITLMVLVTLSLLAALGGLVPMISYSLSHSSPDFTWLAKLLGALTVPILQIGTLFGLNHARKRDHYVNAMVAMVLATIPCINFSGILLLPLSLPIWGLILLSRQDIKATFHSNRPLGPE